VTLERFDDSHLPELMTWFPDELALKTWGGPEFRFPFTEASFREDAKLTSLPTWALIEDGGALAAFGQCYIRVGRCHFGRLAVSPTLRGRGYGTTLIRELARWGTAEFATDSLSLFVSPANVRARGLYRRLGFFELPYPDPSFPLHSFIYMVATKLSG
jgi:ribosomal protein S18 acetylase RimI-like enzyme